MSHRHRKLVHSTSLDIPSRVKKVSLLINFDGQNDNRGDMSKIMFAIIEHVWFVYIFTSAAFVCVCRCV